MNRKVDIFLTTITLILLAFALIAELGNLVNFGSQEFYLQHPEFPEGENYNKAIENGKLELILWTILTISLLTMILYSKFKKNQKLFNRTSVAIFIFATYLPILTITNGLIVRGLIMLIVIIGLIAITLFQIRQEKRLAIT